jgi:arsenate reductase
MKTKILVLCTGNSCRSQIAHGYIQLFGGDKVEVYSAGVETHGVNPKAIATMQEDGVDISAHTSNNILEYQGINFDFIITVCDNAKERCPYFPSKAMKLHHNFPDPAKAVGTDKQVKKEFERVRNLIKNFCQDFINKNVK